VGVAIYIRMMTTAIDYKEININKGDKYSYEQEG